MSGNDIDPIALVNKLPEIDRSEIDMWYQKVETIFEAKHVNDPMLKLAAVVESFDEEAMLIARPFLLRKGIYENPYLMVKEALLAVGGRSVRERINVSL